MYLSKIYLGDYVMISMNRMAKFSILLITVTFAAMISINLIVAQNQNRGHRVAELSPE